MEAVERDQPAPAEEAWTKVITPHRGLFDFRWQEVWRYRDLVLLLASRDLLATHKQTILGPLWFVLQPVATSIAFGFLFGRMARLGSDHVPHFLFYMSGLMAWNFFADCANKTATTFSRNAQLFGKVYFPRLTVPVASALTSLATFCVQCVVFAVAVGIFALDGQFVHPNWRALLLPIFLLQAGMLGLGVGCIVAALTTRYKDFSLGIGFALQLWMYASSVVFPISRIAPESRWIFYLNPMVPVVEAFRFALLGAGHVEKWHLGVSFAICAAIFAIGLMMFNRVEQTVMDTV